MGVGPGSARGRSLEPLWIPDLGTAEAVKDGEVDVAERAAQNPEVGRVLHPTGAALKLLQILGSGTVAGVLGGMASQAVWVGLCFGMAGVLAALTFMDCRCACVKPGSEHED
jgi:hypothetical protein